MWEVINGKLSKEFKFKDFVEAFEFMRKVAVIAEQKNHHPEWTNVYNKVLINLYTHDEKAITQKDHELSEEIDKISNQ